MSLPAQIALIKTRGEYEVKDGPNPGVYIIHKRGVFQSSRRPDCLVVDTKNRTVEHPARRLTLGDIMRPVEEIAKQLLK